MNSPQNGNGTLGHGSILVEMSTLLPEPLRLESNSTDSGWARVEDNLNGQQLAKKLTTAGWTFFYMAGGITKIAFGFEKQGMIRAALKRLIATVTLQNCNCLEIDDVAMHSFLGIPYVSIAGHSRHIQKGMAASGSSL